MEARGGAVGPRLAAARSSGSPCGKLETWIPANLSVAARARSQVSRFPARRLALAPGDRRCGVVAFCLKSSSKRPLLTARQPLRRAMERPEPAARPSHPQPNRMPLHCPRHGGRRVNDTPTERGVESTWTRLRRRKVVQWGLVYVAAAWGFLQGLEYVSDTFRLAAADPADRDPSRS